VTNPKISRARVGRSAFSLKKKNKKTGGVKIKSRQGRAKCFFTGEKKMGELVCSPRYCNKKYKNARLLFYILADFLFLFWVYF
jgi:hypothetical protein